VSLLSSRLTLRSTGLQVAKLIAERDTKEDELTALLKLSAQDLWVRDLDAFDEQWSVRFSPRSFPRPCSC
jgi:hypothetical protein